MDQGMTQHRRPMGWRRRIYHGCLVSEFVSQPYLGLDLTLLQPGCGFPVLPSQSAGLCFNTRRVACGWLMDLVCAANFHLEHLNGARLERADARDASPHWDAQAPRRILIESSSKTFRYP